LTRPRKLIKIYSTAVVLSSDETGPGFLLIRALRKTIKQTEFDRQALPGNRFLSEEKPAFLVVFECVMPIGSSGGQAGVLRHGHLPATERK